MGTAFSNELNEDDFSEELNENDLSSFQGTARRTRVTSNTVGYHMTV
jgi:hypothetical protein